MSRLRSRVAYIAPRATTTQVHRYMNKAGSRKDVRPLFSAKALRTRGRNNVTTSDAWSKATDSRARGRMAERCEQRYVRGHAQAKIGVRQAPRLSWTREVAGRGVGRAEGGRSVRRRARARVGAKRGARGAHRGRRMKQSSLAKKCVGRPHGLGLGRLYIVTSTLNKSTRRQPDSG